MQAQIDPNSVILLCDGEQDKELFLRIRETNSRLKDVPEQNVRTYQQARTTNAGALDRATAALHQDDRPDWIFCINDNPILVVELTRHAYTGDNGLQRFARFAAAAENGVAFIYFGPLSRVRDDELDGTASPSRRRLTSHLFAGMDKLASIYNTPQLFVPWPVMDEGLPASLPFQPTSADIQSIYGELLDTVSAILFEASSCESMFFHPLVNASQRRVGQLARVSNVREGDVTYVTSKADIANALQTPRSFLKTMSQRNNYFEKGKPDKLLAAYALQQTSLDYVMDSLGRTFTVRPKNRAKLITTILDHPIFSKEINVYYTGYKWRSDPHCGAFVNFRYRLAEIDPQTRSRLNAFVLLYPRVSLNCGEGTGASLARLSAASPHEIQPLFEQRYGEFAANKMAACLTSSGLYGQWVNSTKQARLFRRYADLIILNDGVIVGENLEMSFS